MIAPTRASAATRPPGRSWPSSAHAAGGRLGEAEQQPDQRGLAGAVGAKEAEGTAARDLEVDAVERRSRPEPLAKTPGLDGEGLGFDERIEVMRRRYGRPRARFRRKAERHPPKRMRCLPAHPLE